MHVRRAIVVMLAGVAFAGALSTAEFRALAAFDSPQQQQQTTAPPPPAPQQPGQRGRGGGRGRIQVMTLTSASWQDGGTIPLKHAQAGDEVSPPLAWSNVPADTASFVLLAHDLDAATEGGREHVLHWMLWNIPKQATSLAEGLPAVPELPDGTRQISATGPQFRGPGAPADGPRHHYVFELYALDTMIDVPAVGATPAETRTAIRTAMADHIRGKGVLIGLYKRDK